MDLKNRLSSELLDAIRKNDDVRKRTIRMAIAAIKLVEIEKGGALDENALLSIIQREIKNRREASLEAQQAKRPDLVEAADDEIRVLETYLPKQLTSEELSKMAREAIQEVNATNPADMGKVMKVLLPKVQGRASGDRISQAVHQLLQSNG